MTPRWIRAIERDFAREPFSKWIHLGSTVLVSSATVAGWRLRTEERGARALAQHRQTLQRRLLGLPERVGMFDVPRWQTVAADKLLARCCGESLGGVQGLSLSDLPFMDVLQELEQAVGLTPSALLPADVIRLTVQVLRQRQSTQAEPVDGLAMAAVGVATRGLRSMTACSVCYRFAFPGHSLCGEHSSTDEAVGPLGVRKLAYQRAKIALPRFTRLASSVPRGVNVIEVNALAYIVARIAWGVSPPDEARTRRVIRSLIAESAPLRDRLGMQALTLPHGEGLYELLRDRLDPLEMGVGAWVSKLRLADAWLSALDEVLLAQRGAGALRQARLYDAVFLGRRGASRAEIARELEVDRSTVSQWLKRNDLAGELRSVLASAPRGRARGKR
jgi:hypothetical protein